LTDSPIALGNHRQLFIDDYVIAETNNIIRRVCPVQKYPKNPIVRPDRPWEGSTTVPQGSVIYDAEDSCYKMWYTTDIHSLGKGLAYAVSADGVRWEKPEMDIVRKDGRLTNLVIPALEFGYMYQSYCVLKDLREPDLEKRYKLAFLSIQRNVKEHESPAHPGTRRGLGIAFSPDGLRWTLAKDFASDDIIDISHIMVDPQKDNAFVIYGRTLEVLPEIERAWGQYDWFEPHYNGRAVIRSASRDFLNWDPAELVMSADLQDPVSTMIYSMNVFPYKGIYLGLVQRYISEPGIGTIDIQLAISRDGVNFEHPFREPFFPLGEIGTWDRFILLNMSGPPQVNGDELRFYYGGRAHRHRPTKVADSAPSVGNIGIASILQDRFVAVEASFDGGTLTTKPFRFEGSTLYVNCNTSFGKLGIRVLDQTGKPMEAYQTTIEGIDGVRCPVRFGENSIGQLCENPIRIEFTVNNARLYSFCVQ